MNNNFAENLRKIRKEHKLSQEELAEDIGVSRQAISKWESSLAYPEMDKIILLCDKFDLNIDDLLHRDITETKSEEETKNKINKSFEDFLKFITDSINLFTSMNFKSKIKCLFEQIIIVLTLLLISFIITDLTESLIYELFMFLPTKIYELLHSISSIVIRLFCIISSIIIYSHIFKTRYLDYYNKLKSSVKKEEVSKNDKTINNENKVVLKNNEDKIIIRDPKHSEYRFINGLFKFIVLILKLFIFCLTIFLSLTLICSLGAFIISFLLYKTRLFFIGLLITIISIIIINVILLLINLNFIFNRKNDKKKIIYVFLLSLITFGIGCGLIFVGTLDFEIDETTNDLLETKEIEIKMNDNTFFYDLESITYVESNINNIKLEYKSNKYCNLELHGVNSGEIYYYNNCINVTKIIKDILKNINNKKLISFNTDVQDVIVYASKENIEKLKENAKNHYQKEEELRTREEKINDYEHKIEDLEEEIYTCENKLRELDEN